MSESSFVYFQPPLQLLHRGAVDRTAPDTLSDFPAWLRKLVFICDVIGSLLDVTQKAEEAKASCSSLQPAGLHLDRVPYCPPLARIVYCHLWLVRRGFNSVRMWLKLRSGRIKCLSQWNKRSWSELKHKILTVVVVLVVKNSILWDKNHKKTEEKKLVEQ